MARISRVILILAASTALLSTSAVMAQVPLGPIVAMAPDMPQVLPPPQVNPPLVPKKADPGDPLPGFPVLEPLPRSLMQPESVVGPHGTTPERPYFELNPYLDPPSLPQPGWFGDAEVSFVAPNFKNQLTEQVTTRNSVTSTVHAPGASLDWTVAPRFEVGYRLESGFGEFALSYRFLNSTGGSTGQGPDGPASLNSRLDFNIVDLDYASREFSLWPHWDMKWRLGARVSWIYYDAEDQESAAVAGTGSGLKMEQNTNYFVGAGPHGALELARHFEDTGLAFVGKVDASGVFGQLRQTFNAQTIGGATGLTRDVGQQDVPSITVDLGLSWQPAIWQNFQVFAGYQYEYWWNVGRFDASGSRAEMSDQGVLLRASINY